MTDHAEVDQLLQLLSGGTCDREAAFGRLKQAVYIHVIAEEDTLYPAVIHFQKEFIDQAYREHAQVNQLLRRMERAGVNDGAFPENVATLAGLIRGHVVREESHLIPLARDMLGEEEVQGLSARFVEVGERIAQRSR